MDKERKVKIRKKLYFIVIVMIIIIAMLIPFVFASVPMQEPTIESKQFFTVDSLTKTLGSTLEMSLNLNCIEYEDYIFTLSLVNGNESSDTDISDVISNINEEVDMEYDKNEGNIVISGNKTKMNMSEIKLYYKIPADTKTGTTITFKAEIENASKQAENDEQNYIQSNEISSEIVESFQEGLSQKETIEVTITIVEEHINTDNDNGNKDEQELFVENDQNKEQDLNNQQESNTTQNNQFTSMQTNSSSIKSISSVQTETVTYNGSSNNYLKSLQIDGYTLNKEFSKENTTYFVELQDEEVSSIDITAEAEDETATVCIYGNDNIKEGSKILISVTAENGNVRTYRVIVVNGDGEI